MISKEPEKIKEMFNRLAVRYDFNNAVISLGLHKKIKFLSLKLLKFKDGARVLDLCTGTGDVANFVKQIYPKSVVTGVDFSSEMLKIARGKVNGVEFIEADCTALPFSDESFDDITISFGLRNIENYGRAIEEMARVLVRGGKVLHLDFGKSALSGVFDFVVRFGVKIFYGQQLDYEYLVKSKREFFAPENLATEFAERGLKQVARRDFLFGIISAQVFEKS